MLPSVPVQSPCVTHVSPTGPGAPAPRLRMHARSGAESALCH
ncbi:hypothetical protein STVIR_3329 [Streptomyces viridochromogenes Tue57]|uniref:Uncharacterized protein n=1 Tax=Streptomyces viridochromogenes Tue57 TaxID=1160705 RepID=L8PDY4_STRVR|nr:hypothetical protein STVIR_3329 [Streptomyces viridochromogenes Tue57]